MDRIQKFLLKLDEVTRMLFLNIFVDIVVLNLEKYDVKALKGMKGFFRLRKGNIRVIFMKKNGKGYVVNIDFRKDVYR